MGRPTPDADELIKELAGFEFSRATRRRLTRLMNLNTEGELSPDQRQELDALVEIDEQIAVLKARAMLILSRRNG